MKTETQKTENYFTDMWEVRSEIECLGYVIHWVYPLWQIRTKDASCNVLFNKDELQFIKETENLFTLKLKNITINLYKGEKLTICIQTF